MPPTFYFSWLFSFLVFFSFLSWRSRTDETCSHSRARRLFRFPRRLRNAVALNRTTVNPSRAEVSAFVSKRRTNAVPFDLLKTSKVCTASPFFFPFFSHVASKTGHGRKERQDTVQINYARDRNNSRKCISRKA